MSFLNHNLFKTLFNYSMPMVDMNFFFNPKSIAVIGASSKPGKIGFQVLKSLIDAGYKHPIYPININTKDILGFKTYKNIIDVPNKVDLVLYALPAKYAPNAVEECGKKHVKGMVIISGGFKELNGEGAELERKTVENAKKHGIRIIGPNCIGILNPKNNVDTFFQPRYAMSRPKKGNVSVLTQSGTFGLSMLELLAKEDLGISRFISYGNRADVDELEMLRYLEKDKETKIVALYVESLDDGREFVKLAKKFVLKKPIIVLKGGRTKKGAQAAKSHTGSLAGNDAAFIGAMKQSGVILVDDIDELVDVVKILLMQPLPKGNKVAMVTNGVGPCVVATDEIELSKYLNLANLNEKSIKKLKEYLPEFCVFSNPLDITGSATAEWYKHSLDILKKDNGVDILMPFFVFQDAPLSETIRKLHKIMKEENDLKKPIVCVALGWEFTRRQIETLQKNKIPCIPTPKRAVKALNKVAWYSEYLRKKS